MARPELNLLDYEIEHPPSPYLTAIIAAGAIIVAIMIMLVLWSAACSKEKAQEVQLMRLQKQLDRLAPVSSGDLTKLNGRIKTKRNLLEGLVGERSQWTKALAAAEGSIPKEITIESISAADRSLVIRGTAPGFSTLMMMVESISNDPGVGESHIKSAEEIDGQVSFEMEVSV